MECTTISVVTDTGLACPDCNRAYQISELQHQCGALRCTRYNTSSLSESYLDDVKIDAMMVLLRCSDCEDKWHEINDPREGICPKCNFVGTYPPREDQLCPACVPAPVPVAKPLPARRVRTRVTESALPTLYLRVEGTDALSVSGHTLESIKAGSDVLFCMWLAPACGGDPRAGAVADGVAIAAFLAQYRSQYIIKWIASFEHATRLIRAGHAVDMDFGVTI